MNRSDTINELATALAAAQAELHNPAFDSANPHFKSKFASLAGVRDTITPTLTKHGLSVLQILGNDDNRVTCETVLMHKSGQWISGTFAIAPTKPDAQGTGSAATYARRYALMAIVNVVGDEDDDGNAAAASVRSVKEGNDTPQVPPARAKVVRRVADACIAMHAAENFWGCYEEAAAITNGDERMLLWDYLHDHSKVRSTIKEYANLAKEQAPA